jgi:hypothetical protein
MVYVFTQNQHSQSSAKVDLTISSDFNGPSNGALKNGNNGVTNSS